MQKEITNVVGLSMILMLVDEHGNTLTGVDMDSIEWELT